MLSLLLLGFTSVSLIEVSEEIPLQHQLAEGWS